MINVSCDKNYNTTGINEVFNIFAPYFENDLTVELTVEDTFVLCSAEGTSARVVNDGTTSCVKLCCYMLLSKLSGIVLPWGSLTGVKPVRRILSLMSEGLSPEEIKSGMKLKYMLSDEKLEMLYQTALTQKSFLYPHPNACALYVHVPLCPAKCTYCSFPSVVTTQGSELCEAYLNALLKELAAIDAIRGDMFYDCVYIGGGTPSIFSEDQLERLLSYVKKIAPYAEEITFEAGRCDTTTKEKLKVLYENGVTRISLNPQSTNDETLRRLNRMLTYEDFLFRYEDAVKAGFSDINCDLIFGLPGEGEADFSSSLAKIIALKPSNITLHSLCAKRSAQVDKQQTYENSENVAEFQNRAMEKLAAYFYSPYYLYRQKYSVSNSENVGYTLPGKACVYNVRMMGDTETILSAGAGSATKLYFPKDGTSKNFHNIKELSLYNSNIDAVIEKKLAQIKEAVR